MTKICASSICPVAWVMAPARAVAASSLERSSKPFRRTKMVAALEPNEKLEPSRPAKATVPSTPAVPWMILVARSITAWVRSRDAPAGSWMTPIRKP